MKLISGTEELMRKVCAIIGADAFGAGDISIAVKSVKSRQKMLDGAVICSVRALLSAGGYGGREALISAVDSAAEKALAYSSGEGVLSVTPLSPAILAMHDDKGYMRFEQEYEIIFLEAGI